MLTYYFKTTADKKFKVKSDARPGCLIVGTNVDLNDLEKISKLTGLTLADIDDVLDEHELPRIEKPDNSVLLFLRVPSIDVEASTKTIAVIFHPNYLIILCRTTSDSIAQLLAQSVSITTTQKSKLLITFLHQIAHDYTLQVRELRKKTQLHSSSLEKVDMKTIKQLVLSEEVLNQYLVSLSPMKTVYDVLLSGKSIALFEEDNELIEDALISISQSVEICAVNLKSIRSIRDSFQILFSNELNQTMKFLTSITIILTIPTIIASLFGMNVGLPLAEHPYAFVLVLSGSFVFSSVLLVLFWWKRWV